jgi:hypothetical protein
MGLYGSTQIAVTLPHVASHYAAKENTELEQREREREKERVTEQFN